MTRPEFEMTMMVMGFQQQKDSKNTSFAIFTRGPICVHIEHVMCHSRVTTASKSFNSYGPLITYLEEQPND